jgi:hypothetical protein
MNALVLIALVIFSAACAQKPRQAENDLPRITQFYATTPATPRDESATLCYGVDNAQAVRIDPPVESLKPS